MAWSTPRTWNAGETVTASLMNAHLRDQLNVLVVPHDTTTGKIQALTSAYIKTFPPAQFVMTQLVDFTSNANSGTGETNLTSLALAAALLSVDGQGLRVRGQFLLAANGNTKTIKFYFGATSVTMLSVATSGQRVIIEMVLRRTSATAQKITGYNLQSGTNALAIVAPATASETLANSITVKFTGQGGATSDITQEHMTVEALL